MLRAALLHSSLDSGLSPDLQSINPFVFASDNSSVVVLFGGLMTWAQQNFIIYCIIIDHSLWKPCGIAG